MKFPRVEFLETAPKFRKRKKNSSSCVFVLHKTSHQEISRPSRAVTEKKCTKKCNARAELLFWLVKRIAFLPFLLPSPSSLLKLPHKSNAGISSIINLRGTDSLMFPVWRAVAQEAMRGPTGGGLVVVFS